MSNEPLQEYSVFEEHTPFFTHATRGERFVHFIVDMIVAYIITLIIIFIAALAIPSFLDFAISLNDGSLVSRLEDQLLTTLLFGLVYSLIEGLGKGRTVGKLITRTRAVNADGTPIGWKKAFQRGFSRIVPFEPLSGFADEPWHDRWTNTMVIKLPRR